MPIGWGLERKALANSSSPTDPTELRRGVVPVLRAVRAGLLFGEDFFLIVFGGIAEAAIVGLITETKQEHQAAERLD
jgi:hypothetical protein